ncbi:MAG: FMN-binding protein [Methylococcales bacterium]|nr:FMN-binding protein [Methylococcales bacterium]
MSKILLTSLLLLSFSVFSDEYQSKENFLIEAFSGTPPKPKVLWLKKDRKKIVSTILKHKPGFMRTRYWVNTEQSVWILDEIGKTKPITVAIIIKNAKISSLKVLAFRESRGWEVKHDFFTNQFKQNSLNPSLNLIQPVDGISGATLSVRALTKIAQLALFFDSQISHEK